MDERICWKEMQNTELLNEGTAKNTQHRKRDAAQGNREQNSFTVRENR